MFNRMKLIKYSLILYIVHFTTNCLCELQDDVTNNIQQHESVNFTHETCQMETVSSKEFRTYYPVDKFFNHNGVIELLVRFMGIADGHIALTVNATEDIPRNNSYVISLGSYNNKISEIRRNSYPPLQFKMNTPGILSENQYRGFLIRYNPNTGGIYVFAEGSEIPLLHMIDPNPLRVNYFSFSTWNNRIVQVAFNCKAKDAYSTLPVGDPEEEVINPRLKKKGSFSVYHI